MGFDVLVGVPSARVLLVEGKQLHKFLRNAGFQLTTGNLPVAQVSSFLSFLWTWH